MKQPRKLTGSDAIRLLCNAVQKLHAVERFGNDAAPPCYDTGEYIIQDALAHLARGDTNKAKTLIAVLEDYRRTGAAPAPYADFMDDGIPF